MLYQLSYYLFSVLYDLFLHGKDRTKKKMTWLSTCGFIAHLVEHRNGIVWVKTIYGNVLISIQGNTILV